MSRPVCLMRKTALSIVVLIAVSSVASAATTVGLQTWWASGSFYDAYRTMVDEFNAQSKDVQVELQIKTGDASEQLLVAIAGGALPDMAALEVTTIRRFYEMGVLVPFEDLARSSGTPMPNYSDMYPAIRQVATFNGKTYINPMHVGVLALYYNTQMFEQAGLDSSRGPRTWDELVIYGSRLTRDTNSDGVTDVWGMQLPNQGNNSTVIRWEPFLWQNGGEIFDANGNPTFHDSRGVEALQFWVDAVHQRAFAPAVPGHADFRSGKGAMMMDFPVAGRTYTEDGLPFATDTLPMKERRASVLGGWHLAVLNTPRKEAAFKFIEWISRPDNYAKYLSIIGYLPARQSVLRTVRYQEFMRSNPYMAAHVQSLDFMRTGAVHPNYAELRWNAFVAPYFKQALDATVPVQAALSEAANAWIALVNQQKP